MFSKVLNIKLMKYFFIINLLLSLLSCKTSRNENTAPDYATTTVIKESLKLETSNSTNYANHISISELKEDIYTLASDGMQGRATGKDGQKKAAEFLREKYRSLGIPSPKGIDYFQTIPKEYFNGKSEQASENVLAYIEGSTYPDEVLVISAHYDHIGIDENGIIFNGADDDASGTMGVFQIAKAFAKAKKEGKGPKRSILFLHVTGEEIGLYGSKYYTENPLFPLENTVTNLNIDMIGRIDEDHTDTPNYIYLIGSDRLSNELHEISEQVNATYSDFNFDYTFNDEKDPNRFYYRSDHYNFAKNNVPIIFYFNGVHGDYHKISDTPDKIEYELLTKRCKLIFHTAWELANRKDRVKLITP